MDIIESYSRHIDQFSVDAERDLQAIRNKYYKNLSDQLQKRSETWQAIYSSIVKKSAAIKVPDISFTSLSNNNNNTNINKNEEGEHDQTKLNEKNIDQCQTPCNEDKSISESFLDLIDEIDEHIDRRHADETSHDTSESKSGNCSNLQAIEDFMNVRTTLDETREKLHTFVNDSSYKLYRNELLLCIRTQINTISNTNSHMLNAKIRILIDLLSGKEITFQQKTLNATQHEMGPIFCMDLAAETFVTVGPKLLNSVPDIAISMATVINGLIKAFPLFKDLLFGHLKIRCPFLIPMYPPRTEATAEDAEQNEINYKIACGYSYNAKQQVLESDDNYINKMRSFSIIFACILMQDDMKEAWKWLASFLNLEPHSVISATILQAFLQQSSSKLSQVYGRQYLKLLNFIKFDYVSMIDKITPVNSDRQSFVKLKNFLNL